MPILENGISFQSDFSYISENKILHEREIQSTNNEQLGDRYLRSIRKKAPEHNVRRVCSKKHIGKQQGRPAGSALNQSVGFNLLIFIYNE